MSLEIIQLNQLLKYLDIRCRQQDQQRHPEQLTQRDSLLYWSNRLSQHSFKTPVTSIPPAELYEPSAALKHFWLGFFLEKSHVPFNVTMPRFVPALQLNEFKTVCQNLINQYEILRTIPVFQKEEKKVLMRVLPFLDVNDILTIRDISNEPDKKEIFNNEVDKARNHIFDFGTAPALHFTILYDDKNRSLVIFNISHTLFDGYSKIIFEREFERLYEKCLGKLPLSAIPPALQYKDFCHWEKLFQQQPLSEYFREYWLRYTPAKFPEGNLSDRFREKPVTDVSYRQSLAHRIAPYIKETDPSTIAAFYGIVGKAERTPAHGYRFVLTGDTFEAINALCRSRGTGLFNVLVAAFNVYLSQLTGYDDIVLGSNVALRDQPALQEMPGFLVNTLLIRTQVTPYQHFNDALTEATLSTAVASSFKYYTMAKLLDDLDVPFERINTIFLNTYPAAPGALLTDFSSQHQQDPSLGYFEIDLHIKPFSNGIEFRCYYDCSIYTAEVISGLFKDWMQLLSACLQQPDMPVDTLLPGAGLKQQTLRQAEGL